MTREEYKEYLKQPHWKSVKDRLSKKREKICYCCFKRTINLDIHHKTYKRLGMERDRDLVYVCHKCHDLIHKQYQDNKKIRGINIATITESLRNKNQKLFRIKKPKKNHNQRTSRKPIPYKKKHNQTKWYSNINKFSQEDIVKYKQKMAEIT